MPEYDVAVCQSVAKNLSDVYKNINSVAHSIARDSRKVRNQLGINQPFRITYMSSGTTGAGQGLVAIYAEAALSRGMDYTKYKIQVNRFKSSVKGFTIVKDIVYSRNRARLRGQDVVNLPTAIIGKMVGMAPIILIQGNQVHPPVMQRVFSKSVERLFTYATARIKEELYFDCVNIGIAGSPQELETYPAFHHLRESAQQKGVQVMVSVLTLASSINFSPGCIALGIAPKDQVSLP